LRKRTLAEVAAELGVQTSTLSKMERGAMRISAGQMAELARILEVRVGRLYGEASR